MKVPFRVVPILICFVLITLSTVRSEGQTVKDCGNMLLSANKAYESGHFNECIQFCLQKLRSSESFEAYRLMALSYLNLNDIDNTKNSIKHLLRNKPDYRQFPYFDPLPFTKLLAKFDVFPMFEIGAKAGMNVNSIHPIKNFSISGSNATYRSSIGFQAGLTGEYFIKKRASLSLDVLYQGINYQRNASDVSGWKQEYIEKMKFIGLPVSVHIYKKPFKGWQLAGELGILLQILNQTHSNLRVSNEFLNENIQKTVERESARNKFLYSFIAGIFAKHPMGGGQFVVNVNYAYGLNNVVKPGNRWDNLNFIMNSQYVDGDFSFNTVYLNLGWQVPINRMYTVLFRE